MKYVRPVLQMENPYQSPSKLSETQLRKRSIDQPFIRDTEATLIMMMVLCLLSVLASFFALFDTAFYLFKFNTSIPSGARSWRVIGWTAFSVPISVTLVSILWKRRCQIPKQLIFGVAISCTLPWISLAITLAF
ncbi:MAG: hypothetical protein AAF664_13190 [Planctomycetota bacterium]